MSSDASPQVSLQGVALEPPSACPVALLLPELQPTWKEGNSTEVGSRLVGVVDALTLYARVRSSGSGPCRILQQGEPPNGWLFEAPSATGVIAFSSGPRDTSKEEDGEAGAEVEGDGEKPERGETDVGNIRVDDGSWHHVAIVVKSSRVRSFVDGVPDGDASFKVTAPRGALLLCGPADGNAGETRVEDVRIFFDALSDDQIRGLMQEARSLPTGISLPMLPPEVIEFWDEQAKGEPSGIGIGSRGTPSARDLLTKCLGLGVVPGGEFQDEVICDFFVDLLDFCKKSSLTARKTCVAVAILHVVLRTMHKRSRTTIHVGDPYTMTESFLEYKKLLLAHANTSSATDSAETFGVFSVSEARQITEFVSGSLFAHFELYKCVLVKPQMTSTKHAEATLDCPVPPPRLLDGKQVPKGQLTAAKQRPKSKPKPRPKLPVGSAAAGGYPAAGAPGDGTVGGDGAGEGDEHVAGLEAQGALDGDEGEEPIDENVDPLDAHVTRAAKKVHADANAAIVEHDRPFVEKLG